MASRSRDPGVNRECMSGALRMMGVDVSRRPDTPPNPRPESTSTGLRLASEAADLRSRARDLQVREDDLSSSYDRLETHRTSLRDREAQLRTREAALTAREEEVRKKEAEAELQLEPRMGSMISLMPAGDTQRTWVRVIEDARRAICILFYTLDLDIVCLALEAAAQRGIPVRLLGDKRRVRQ